MRCILSKLNLRRKLVLIIVLSTLMLFLLQLFYYSNFYVLTENSVELHTFEIIKQLEDRIRTFKNDIKDAAIATSFNTNARNFLSSTDPIYRLGLYNSVMELMTGIKSSNKNIESIILIDAKQINFGATTPRDYLVIDEVMSRQNQKTAPFYGKLHSSSTGKDNSIYYYVLPSQLALTTDNASMTEGLIYCLVLYKTNYIDRILEDIQATENAVVLVMDNEHKVMAANKKELKNTVFDFEILNEGRHAGDNKVMYQQKLHHLHQTSLSDLDLDIISLIPVKEATNDLVLIRNKGLMIGLLMTLLIFAMGMVFIRSVTMPFGRIIRFLNYIGNNGGKQRLKMSDTHELGTIALEINKMLDKIDETNEKFIHANTSLYQMEIAKKQAELSYLQSQINPHFLYNTLECIRSIALAKGVMEVVEISTAISNIFRYSIKDESDVLLNEEISCIEDYLRVMSIRYMDKFTTTIDIDPSLYKERIPKMILQPLVENAIYHGLERKRGKGRLLLTGRRTESQYLRFEIVDDGIGIEAGKLAQLQQALREEAAVHLPVETTTKGVGILNIHRRIRLEHGDSYGITIESRKQHGTTVILELSLADHKQPETER